MLVDVVGRVLLFISLLFFPPLYFGALHQSGDVASPDMCRCFCTQFALLNFVLSFFFFYYFFNFSFCLIQKMSQHENQEEGSGEEDEQLEEGGEFEGVDEV